MMRRMASLVLAIMICAVNGVSQGSINRTPPSIADLRADGTRGFPQQYAQLLCDRPDLRVSVYNSPNWLYVQAVLWEDGDSTLGKTPRGEDIGDTSALILHLDDTPSRKPYMDRNYYLNPWPSKTGLYFTIVLDEKTTTMLKKETENRGELEYVLTSEGRRVRVDSYMIPLNELAKRPGDTIRLCYYARSPAPEYTTDSANSTRKGRYAEWQIPVSEYHEVVLQRGAIDFRGLP